MPLFPCHQCYGFSHNCTNWPCNHPGHCHHHDHDDQGNKRGANYCGSKELIPDECGNPGHVYPLNATVASHCELEPLITPDQLVTRHLFGIPLISRIVDPITGKPMVFTNDILKDYINRATQEAEVETQIDINPKKYHEKLPYVRPDFEAFGMMMLNHKPAHSLDFVSVQLADNTNIFQFPPQWLETANLIYGQINFIPLAFQSSVIGTVVGSTNPQNAVFFNSLWNRNFVQALFGISYTTGFPNREVPIFINELIGTIAAIKVLSSLAATYARVTSTSLGLDGVSQAISGPGPLLFITRLQDLEKQRQLLVGRARAFFGSKIVLGSI